MVLYAESLGARTAWGGRQWGGDSEGGGGGGRMGGRLGHATLLQPYLVTPPHPHQDPVGFTPFPLAVKGGRGGGLRRGRVGDATTLHPHPHPGDSTPFLLILWSARIYLLCTAAQPCHTCVKL
jgi:hypothetical protein